MVQNYNGTPVEFGHSVEFYCASSDLYFEHERDLQKWKLKCMPGGIWDVPQIWPRCVTSKNFLWSELKSCEWDILNPNPLIWVSNVHTFYFHLNSLFLDIPFPTTCNKDIFDYKYRYNAISIELISNWIKVSCSQASFKGI